MSDDIVSRLRTEQEIDHAWPLMMEAADEIERLRRDLARETQMYETAARLATEHEQRMRAAPRLILDNWDDWDGEAQFDAQREQTPDAYVNTMLLHFYEVLGLPDDRE